MLAIRTCGALFAPLARHGVARTTASLTKNGEATTPYNDQRSNHDCTSHQPELSRSAQRVKFKYNLLKVTLGRRITA